MNDDVNQTRARECRAVGLILCRFGDVLAKTDTKSRGIGAELKSKHKIMVKQSGGK